jgi:PTH1 family peptidyl-tRNA hydrolase
MKWLSPLLNDKQPLLSDHVFVGLGNPGKKYEMTRHNLGFLVVKAFAEEYSLKFKEESRFHALMARGQADGKNLFLLMPTTYMNESGRAVKALIDYYKLDLNKLVVVSDDIALEFGVMRLRLMGSSGGHNGLKSIAASLGTHHYARLRMGIGPGTGTLSMADHVLDNFTEEELKSLPEVLKKGASALKQLLTENFTHVMSNVNAKLKIKPPQTGVGENRHES